MDNFENELKRLINKYSMENKWDMPDFLMAKAVVNFIDAMSSPIKNNLDWHGTDSICHPGKENKLK